MRGRLEREIRLLPQVLACTISEDDVIVLVPPAADPIEIEQAVVGVLGERAATYRVAVVGGTEAVPPGPVGRATRSPAMLIGSVITTGLLGLSALATGLARTDQPSAGPEPNRTPTTIVSPEPSHSEPAAGPTSDPREQVEPPPSRPPQVLGQQVIRGSASPSHTK